jgi:hypothetical protein
MYGGEVEHASVPLYVSSWHLGADLNSNSNMDEDDYMPIAVTVRGQARPLACLSSRTASWAQHSAQHSTARRV